MLFQGVSILITSLTDFVAFTIGSSTILPALRAYCLYAGFGVLFVFLLNSSFFAACVVIDHGRAMSNRPDCCCCCKLKTPHPMFPELVAAGSTSTATGTATHSYCGCLHKIPTELSRRMFKKFGESLANFWVKVGILLAAATMLVISIYGATQLEQNFKIHWFIPDDSFLHVWCFWVFLSVDR